MKLLATLVALQCAGIGFLVYQALGDEPGAPPPAATAPVTADVRPMPLDEARLRQVVREELAALTATTAAAPGAARFAAAPAPRDAEKDRLQRERVAEQIDRYRSVGAITDAQMNELQNDIAQLDPASRREMLGKLSRAMNAQEIQARM
jgi:hypothetical protein